MNVFFDIIITIMLVLIVLERLVMFVLNTPDSPWLWDAIVMALGVTIIVLTWVL